jgi:integrase
LEADAYPTLGARDIASIQPTDMLAVVRAVEARGALDVAARVIQRCANVFRYGILTGRCVSNPASELRGVVKQRKVEHRAALSRAEIPEFLAKLKAYDGRPETRIGLQLLMLTFVRTGELRGARWDEIDLDRAEWRIPAERMKMREEHIVPLASQTIKALSELQRFTAWSELLFPGTSDGLKPISENTMLYALYRMGYHGRATGHGFRALASTCLNELGWKGEVIERQLAHAERNKVRAAYNRAQYLAERRQMMQAWADFIDAQRTGKVVALKRKNSG